MRKLLCVPIIHTEADLGSLKESIRTRYPSQQDWERQLVIANQFWDEINRRIISAGLNYKQLRVYQDGLPVCGRELDIVRDLAAQGSKNHQLVVLIVEKGATLEGTEAPNLLLEEYNYIKAILQAKTEEKVAGAREEYRQKSQTLLQKRDAFIAARIDSTLKDGEVGLLFIGAMHEVEKKLSDDIQIVRL